MEVRDAAMIRGVQLESLKEGSTFRFIPQPDGAFDTTYKGVWIVGDKLDASCNRAVTRLSDGWVVHAFNTPVLPVKGFFQETP